MLSKNVRKQDVRTQDFFRCGGSFLKEFYQNQLETQENPNKCIRPKEEEYRGL